MADDPDVAVFQQLLRPYRAAIMAAIPLIATVGNYGYDVVTFMHLDKHHEAEQNATLLEMRNELREHGAAIEGLRERNLNTSRLLPTDLDLLRAKQIRNLPRRDRERARREFEAQMVKGLNLLVEAQRTP